MKKIIPEIITHFCDRCGSELKKYEIDCTGRADFVARDYSGAAVAGHNQEFELCGGCTIKFKNFLSGKNT